MAKFNKAKCVRLFRSVGWKMGLEDRAIRYWCRPASAFKTESLKYRRARLIAEARRRKKNG